MENKKRLFVIGNGFDLQCKLKSSFKDFYNDTTKNFISNISHLYSNYQLNCKLFDNFDENVLEQNLLYLIFNNVYTNSDTNVKRFLFPKKDIGDNWFDIELLIKKIITKKEDTYQSFYDVMESYYNSAFDEPKFNAKSYPTLNYYIYSFAKFQIDKHGYILTFEEWFDREVNRFEKHFQQYLNNELNNNNKYIQYRGRLLHSVLGFKRDDKMLNFNYTKILDEDDYPNCEYNVHGSLDDKIIIGIDDKDIPLESNEGILLSKSFKKLTYHLNSSKNIVSKDTTDIYFYGHSLGAQDYSYFQSIFDILNIYDNKVSLHFYYSNNFGDEKDKSQRETEYAKKIYKLINIYGQSMDNKDHGKNLLNKMILEKRIFIERKELQPNQYLNY